MMFQVFDAASQARLESMFEWHGADSIDAPLLSSLLIMAVLLLIGAIVGIRATIGLKKKEYLKKPKGILFLAELYYDMCQSFVGSNMGESAKGYGGYFWTLFAYLFISFIFSLFGLPSVVDWLAVPLGLAIIMFVIIQAVAIKYQHFGYFHRYIEPIPVFLPINLITMWSPIISTTMRMFGNCLAGSVIIGLIQWALSNASNAIFGAMGVNGFIGTNLESYWNMWPYWTGVFLAPMPMGVLNLYFSLFSGFVQTLVFASLTALWIAQERPLVEMSANKEKDKKPKAI
ncbi:MAG TPA: hypothetical protein DCZ41_03145 [Firmicutes bacterium]|nr:hypothetical protein [Bacillota bacterium]